MKYFEYLKADGWIGEDVELLLSDGPEQDKIKKWCENNPHNELAEHYNKKLPDNVSPCVGWEASFHWIANAFSTFRDLNAWETATAEHRTTHSKRVAKLARELAKELSVSPSPCYPPVLYLFEDSEMVLEIIFSTDINLMLKEVPNEESTIIFPANQDFPTLLRRLADFAEGKKYPNRVIPRPKTGSPSARAFTLDIFKKINEKFNLSPNEVIASCVCLKFPDLEIAPDGETIRRWRGAR